METYFVKCILYHFDISTYSAVILECLFSLTKYLAQSAGNEITRGECFVKHSSVELLQVTLKLYPSVHLCCGSCLLYDRCYNPFASKVFCLCVCLLWHKVYHSSTDEATFYHVGILISSANEIA